MPSHRCVAHRHCRRYVHRDCDPRHADRDGHVHLFVNVGADSSTESAPTLEVGSVSTSPPLYSDEGNGAHWIGPCLDLVVTRSIKAGVGSSRPGLLSTLSLQATGKPCLLVHEPAQCAGDDLPASSPSALKSAQGRLLKPTLVRSADCNEQSRQHEVQHSRRRTSRPKHALPALGKSST